VTGAWQYRGGGALYGGAALYPLNRALINGLDKLDPSIRMLDMSRIGPVLTGDKRDLGDGPPVTAMLIQNTNPMVVSPDSNRVRRGFQRDDLFVSVHEQFMTETAAMADVVLPATTMLEHDDIYTASAHTFLQVSRRVIEPFAEARSNHFVITELAKRLGAEHPGFRMTEWEIIDRSLAASGLPSADEILTKGGHDAALPFRTAHFLDGFGHADKRFHFATDWAAIGPHHEALSPLPDHAAVIDAADAEHPFRMMAPPARSFLNTTFNNLPSSLGREGKPRARIHPEDLAALGLDDGARIRLGNRQGSVVLHARAFDGLQRGVIVVEGIWPNGAFEEGIGINALVSADPGLPNGGAVFHDTAVWLRAA
jgi:anaerobic selenocysteine-containing dehydrogenase